MKGELFRMDASQKKRFMAGNMYLYFVTGLLVLCTSAIQLYLRQEYHLTQGQGGLLISVQAAGYLITNLISGHLSILTGRKNLLYIAAVMMAVSYGLLIFIPVSMPFLLYVLLFFAGLGWGINNFLLNVSITETFHGQGGPLTMAHTCYAIGAFVAPLMVAAFVPSSFGWRGAAVVVAVLSFTLLLSIKFMPVPEKSKEESKAQANSMTFLKDIRFYIFFMIFFLYVGSENGFSGWIVSYLIQNPFFSGGLAQSMLSMLWIVMIVGRIITSAVAHKMNGTVYAMCISIGYVIMASVLLLTGSPYLMIGAIALMGLCMAGIFSMTMSNASDIVMGSGIASGLLLSAGGFGSIALPYVTGSIADSSSLKTGMWSIVAAVAVMAILSIVIFLLKRRKKPVE